MAEMTPNPPWLLKCYWCEHSLSVGAGRGLDAAYYMEAHVVNVHQKTWREYIALTS